MCSKLSAIGSKSEFSHLLVSFHLRHPGVLRAPPPWLVEGARQNFQRLFQLFCFILKAGLRACVVWVSSPDRIRRVPYCHSLEYRASSCVTGRGGGGWCRRCRLMVVTRVTSHDFFWRTPACPVPTHPGPDVPQTGEAGWSVRG